MTGGPWANQPAAGEGWGDAPPPSGQTPNWNSIPSYPPVTAATPPQPSDWNATPQNPQSSGPVRAPLGWLFVGILAALAGLAIGVAWRSLLSAIGGWVLAGPVAIGLLATFLIKDAKGRQDPWYAIDGATPWLRRVLVVVALIAIAVNAWTIADAVARVRS